MICSVLKKVVATTIVFTGIAGMSGLVQAASFDCAKASTNVEKLICMDAILSQQDEQLDDIYKAALGKIADKESLKQAQRTWLKESRNICKDAMCLMQVYHERIAQLNSLNMIAQPTFVQVPVSGVALASTPESKEPSLVGEGKHKFPLQFKLVEGDSYPLCQPYVDMLNKTQYMEYPACERKLLPDFKQFKAIEWIEISDKKKIKNIMFELIKQQQSRFGEIGSSEHKMILDQKNKNIESGKIKLSLFNFDFEKDGSDEVIYRENRFFPQAKDFNQCNTVSDYRVLDKKIVSENIVKYSIDKYLNLKLGGSDFLFIFESDVINSHWELNESAPSIQLWSVGSYQALCKILIK